MANRMEVETKVVVTGDKKYSGTSNKAAVNDAKKVDEIVANTSNSAEKLKTAVTTAFNKSAVIGWAKIIKDTMNGLIKATEKQSEYIENLNMMQVAFGKSADAAAGYIEKITDLTGFDSSGLTRQLGVFRQISSAMGYTSEVADLLSTNLSKMSLDVSSLFNVTAERAGKALESAITGQVRSIRSLTGADITLATLQQEAYRLGIEKTTREMTRAEKTILIYLSLERQLKNANGDLARTMNSVANQTKVFKEQIITLGRNLGGFLIPILQAILPILNGVLMTINAILVTIQKLFGIDARKLSSEFGIASGGFEGLEEDLDGVSAASQRAKKSLRGFDKLNNITTPSASGSGGGSGSIGGIDPKLLEALKEYDLGDIESQAAKIRDKIMEILGFSKQIDEETGAITWKYKGLEEHLGSFGKALKKFVKFNIDLFKQLGQKGYDLFSKTWDKISGKVQHSLDTISKLWNTFWSDIGNGIDTWGQPIIEGITGLFETIYTTVFEPIITQVITIIDDLLSSIKQIWDKYGKELIDSIGEFMSKTIKLVQKLWDDVFEPIIKPLFEAIKRLWDKFIKDTIHDIIELVAVLITNALKIYNEVIQPLLSWLLDKLKPAFEFVGELISSVFEGAVQGISTVIRTLVNILKGLIEFITGVFTGDWKKAWTGVKDIFGSIMNGLKTLFSTPINWIIDGFNKFIDQINKVKIPEWVPKVGGKGFSISHIQKIGIEPTGGARMDGGFVKSGDVFYANENGKPEYVASFGNQTAVANTDQIVDGIAIGVTKAMIATGAGKETNVVIEAKGDASGLLDFITFEQRKKDRQYGL